MALDRGAAMTDRRIADVVFFLNLIVTIGVTVLDLVLRAWHNAALLTVTLVVTTSVRYLLRVAVVKLQAETEKWHADLAKSQSEADVAATIAEKIRTAQFGGIAVDVAQRGPTH